MLFIQKYPVIAPFASILLAEIAKFLVDILKGRAEKRFISSGGMPSGHSAFVGSLVALVGYLEGVDSTAFAICAVLGVIVMYDAVRLRYEAGKHAAALNKLNPKLALEESLGHTHVEVIVGAAFGAVVTVGMIFI